MAVVFAVYILAIFLLPTLARVAISDDWTYIRSVEYLINRRDFYILPVAAATQITQLFWGGHVRAHFRSHARASFGSARS